MATADSHSSIQLGSMAMAYVDAMIKYADWRFRDLISATSTRSDMESAWVTVWREILDSLGEANLDLDQAEVSVVIDAIQRALQKRSPYHIHKEIVFERLDPKITGQNRSRLRRLVAKILSWHGIS